LGFITGVVDTLLFLIEEIHSLLLPYPVPLTAFELSHLLELFVCELRGWCLQERRIIGQLALLIFA